MRTEHFVSIFENYLSMFSFVVLPGVKDMQNEAVLRKLAYCSKLNHLEYWGNWGRKLLCKLR